MLAELTRKVANGLCLADEEVRLSVQFLIDDQLPVAAKADFLAALATKGETPAEIASFAQELRAKSVLPALDSSTRAGTILDIVGTGGDRLNTFNISTASALVAAAAGITVAKHGNRAVTSRCGSADVLQALGIPIDLKPEQAAQSLARNQFAFFFAPLYHPTFKNIGPARKLCAERGQRTLFNFLGPLLNPARPTAMLMGVSVPGMCSPLATVLQSLGVGRAMVVSGAVGERYLDEISILGDTTVAEFFQEHGVYESVLPLTQMGVGSAKLDDLVGGDPQTNARIIRNIFNGSERGPKREAVVLNSGAALFVGGKARSIAQGMELAAELLDNGKADAKLRELSAGE